MLGYMLNRLLMLSLAYAYPGYECYKSVEKNKPDVEQLRFWCQYWIIIALITVWDPFGDAFISWLPMYSEAKLVICVYLWHPKTQGTKYIYNSLLKPYLVKNEARIDRTLSQVKTQAGDSASLYFQRLLAYGQIRVIELIQLVMSQPTQKPQPAPETTQPAGTTTAK